MLIVVVFMLNIFELDVFNVFKIKEYWYLIFYLKWCLIIFEMETKYWCLIVANILI